jgi:single-stranded-DNA-specific exonuclease
VLDAVATQHPGVLQKFGGHAMAAGMSILQKDFTAFSQAFNDEVDRKLDRNDLHHVVYSDGELSEADINLEFARQLRLAGPWGQGFAEPLFDGKFDVVDRRVIGERHLKFVLQMPGAKKRVEALAFFVNDITWLQNAKKIHLAYTLDINEYNGVQSVQFIIKHARAVT